MRLLLIRHADPDYERDALTAAGRLEAKALAERLAVEPPTHLYVSQLGRARETAAAIAAATGLHPMADQRFNELDWHVEHAEWGRLSAWDVPGETVRDKVPSTACTAFAHAVQSLHAFGDEFLAGHGYRREGDRYAVTEANEHTIAVVGHGGFTRTWLPHLLGLDVERFWCGFWMPPSSITTIVFERHSEAWATPRCLALGDVGHLHRAGLPISRSGLHGRGHGPAANVPIG